jgi:asparagine synthetase B (glutamine-hydrolysing)
MEFEDRVKYLCGRPIGYSTDEDAILFASELKTVLHNRIESLHTKAKVSFSQGHEVASDASPAK